MGTVIRHYVRIDLPEKSGGKYKVSLVEEVFEYGQYIKAQIQWAINCSVNRNGLREKLMCSDAELTEILKKNPGLAMTHFTETHGDDWFRDNLRHKHVKTTEVDLGCVNRDCFLVSVAEGCKKCAECVIARMDIVQETLSKVAGEKKGEG